MAIKTKLLTSSSLYRHPNWVVALGDSRVAQIHADNAFRNKAGYNHFTWGNALAGQRAILVKNLGVSGDRTDQVLARLQTAIDTGAYILYIHCGLNDIAQLYPTAGTSGATAWANIKKMIDAGIAAGMLPLVVIDPGANNLNAAMLTQLHILNQNIRDYAEKVRMVLFDLAAAISSRTSASTTAISLIGTQDGVHESNLAAYLGGKEFATVLTAIMPPRPVGPTSSVQIPANGGNFLLQNPLFANGVGGVVGAGTSGTVAGFWSSARAGAATSVCSWGDAADGSGKEQVVQGTFTAANEEVRITQDVALNLWNPGDILQAEAELVVDAGSTNLAGVYLYLQCNGSGNGFASYTAMDLFPLTAAGTSEGYKVMMQTEKLLIPNYTTKSWVTCYIRAIAAGAGGATFRVRRATVRKRTS